MSSTSIKDGFNGGSDNQLLVNPDGSINVNSTGGGGTSDVNISDAAGNPLTSTNGALNVNTTGSSTVSGIVTTEQAGLDAFQTSQYAITANAIQLAPTPLANRSSLSITVIASPNVAVYIGNSNAVTTTNGYPLFNGSTIVLDLTPTGQVWAVTDTPTQRIAVMEIA